MSGENGPGLHGVNIVCISEGLWDKAIASGTLMAELAKRNDVYFFASASAWGTAPPASRRAFRTYARTGRPVVQEIGPRIKQIVLPAPIPTGASLWPQWMRHSTVRGLMLCSARVRAAFVRRCLASLAVQPDVLFVFWPQDLPLGVRVPARVRCVRVFDEVSLFRSHRMVREPLRQIEREFLPRYDLVFTSSRAQTRNRKTWHPAVHFVPNSVDYRAYAAAARRTYSAPPDMRALRKPVIGFVGGLHSKIDYPLVRKVAEQYRDLPVVLVGEVTDIGRQGLAHLRHCDNVRVLGWRKRDDIPRYVQCIDVSLVPYILNESTHTMYILKVVEHLAAEKPIVSTDLAELRPMARVITLAQTHEQFVAGVGAELSTDSANKRRLRRRFAEHHSVRRHADFIARKAAERLT